MRHYPLIKSIAPVAGVTDPKEQEYLTDLAYRLSRALIVQELADRLGYPKYYRLTTTLTLNSFRAKQRPQRFLHSKQIVKFRNFSQLLNISVYDESGISYRMPDQVKASKSSKWQAMSLVKRAPKAEPAATPGPFLSPSLGDTASRPRTDMARTG